MLFGDFNVDDFRGVNNSSVWSVLLFAIFMIIVSLILLNALIAIMGDSFDKAQEKSRIGYLVSRAQLLAEYEMLGYSNLFGWGHSVLLSIASHLEDLEQSKYRCNNYTANFTTIFFSMTEDFPTKIVHLFLFVAYLFFMIPIWVEIAIFTARLSQEIGRNLEEGDLYVFFPEQYGKPSKEDSLGDDEWFGKLPKILSKLEAMENKENETNQTFQNDLQTMKEKQDQLSHKMDLLLTQLGVTEEEKNHK